MEEKSFLGKNLHDNFFFFVIVGFKEQMKNTLPYL
jgi:hypothetical protein